MRNLIYLLLLTFVYLQTNIDYYAYYYPEKRLIICSKEKYNTENKLFNEFEDDKGFTCLIDLKDGFYSINLFLSMIKGSSSYDLVDINVGENIAYSGIDLGGMDSDEFVKKTLFVKFQNGNVYYSLNQCDGTNCKFNQANNATINNDLLKLNFSLKRPFLRETILLEKQSKLVKWEASDDCDPACVHGICNEGQCLCEEGYSEQDCNKELVPKELRVGIVILLATFVVVFILGILLMYLFYWIFLKLKGSKDFNQNSRDIDIMEKWEANQQ